MEGDTITNANTDVLKYRIPLCLFASARVTRFSAYIGRRTRPTRPSSRDRPSKIDFDRAKSVSPKEQVSGRKKAGRMRGTPLARAIRV